jgi:Putative beta-barrel porin 2
MKRIFVSAGLAAIGAGSLHAATYAPDLSAMDAGKIWSLSGTLRGFYDDNYTTGSGSSKRASWGFEFSPALSLIVPLQQTEIGLRYTYGLYYYQDRENEGDNPIDQTHEADLWIDHAFSERVEGKVMDTLISAQNPQLTSSGAVEPYRVEGNNIDNIGTLTLHTELTMLLSTDLGYQNNYTDYQNHGATQDDVLPTGFIGSTGRGASLAGFLDENANLIWLNLNYEYEPDLTFLIGYQFGLDYYYAGEPIGFSIPAALAGNPNPYYYSQNLNSYSHYVYGGVQYAFNESLSASVQVGVQYTSNDNLPSFDNQSQTSFSPYAQATATYTYLPGSYAQIGLTQSQNSSDTPDVSSSNGSLTTYEESTVIYGSVNHQITPNLLGSVIARWQYSTWHGGANDGGSQTLYDLGLNLSYTISPHLSAEVGYNFDYLDGGQVIPSYHRNREYVGITASY